MQKSVPPTRMLASRKYHVDDRSDHEFDHIFIEDQIQLTEIVFAREKQSPDRVQCIPCATGQHSQLNSAIQVV